MRNKNTKNNKTKQKKQKKTMYNIYIYIYIYIYRVTPLAGVETKKLMSSWLKCCLDLDFGFQTFGAGSGRKLHIESEF